MLYEIHEKIIKLEKEGRKIINFNVGDPDQNTDRRMINAATESMEKGKTHYGSATGEIELREKLAEEYDVSVENVIISPGSKWNIFSILYLIAKGGNIILPTPHWTAYELMAKELGIQIKFLKRELEKDWDIDIDTLQELIDHKTKLILINSPDNPTSKIVSDKVLKDLVEIVNEKKITVLSDETYSDISFVNCKSILDFDGNHIMVGSFSKTFAMTGWRVGFSISDKKLVEQMTKLNQITITCLPSFIQVAALQALKLKDEISKKMKDIYRKRADMANKILGKTKLKFSKPDAPFYIFPECDMDSEKLALDLLDKKGVAITPGSSFGDYKKYFRLALTMPDNEIKKGLEIIAKNFR